MLGFRLKPIILVILVKVNVQKLFWTLMQNLDRALSVISERRRCFLFLSFFSTMPTRFYGKGNLSLSSMHFKSFVMSLCYFTRMQYIVSVFVCLTFVLSITPNQISNGRFYPFKITRTTRAAFSVEFGK